MIFIQEDSRAETVALSEQLTAEFNAWARDFRGSLREMGYAEEAVNAVDLQLTQHKFTGDLGNMRAGVDRYFGDGKDFFAVTVSAPGSFDQFQGADRNAPASQALLITHQLFNEINHLQNQVLRVFAPGVFMSGGTAGNYPEAKLQAYTRAPEIFLARLAQEFAESPLAKRQKNAPRP